ncbi:MAG: VWA domain-containing protein, partial [Bacteroidota bacterium]|nr:VWA domain-containing protein [Bacteroidota bacterium]
MMAPSPHIRTRAASLLPHALCVRVLSALPHALCVRVLSTLAHTLCVRVLSAALFAALLPVALSAQPDLTFKRIRLNWPLVEAYLSVGCDGIKNYSLQASDIAVVEDGRVADDYGLWCPDPTSRCPISVGLVFDASDSMVGEGNAGAKRGGLRFIENMDSFVDEACVIQFNSDVTIWQYMTTDTMLLNRAVNRLPAVGATALWDGIYHGLLLTQSQGSNQCRAVIVLSDGEDNSSSRNLEEIIAFAVLHNIRVFPIGYGDHIREDQLSYLAQITGGNYYQTPDAEGLADIYRDISTVIYEYFQECILTYEPRCADGSMHEVELRLPDLCNGSASKSRWYRAPLDSSTFYTKHLAMGDVTVAGGEEAWLPLEMLSPMFRENFYPFTLDLHYDRQRLQLDRVETPAGTLLSGMEVHTAELGRGARLRIPEVRVLDTSGVMCYAVFRTSTAAEHVDLPIHVDSSAMEKGCLVPFVSDGMVRLAPSAPGVGCTVTAPAVLQWDPLTSSYYPSPFDVLLRLENRGTLPAMGGQVRLNIDPGVYEFVEPATAVQSISDIPLEGVREVRWKIRARPQGEDITGELCFTGTFDNHPNVVCCRQQEIIAAGAVLSCAYEFPELRYDETLRAFVPNPFPLRLTVENVGEIASNALEAVLRLPAGLYFESGETARKIPLPDIVA